MSKEEKRIERKIISIEKQIDKYEDLFKPFRFTVDIALHSIVINFNYNQYKAHHFIPNNKSVTSKEILEKLITLQNGWYRNQGQLTGIEIGKKIRSSEFRELLLIDEIIDEKILERQN